MKKPKSKNFGAIEPPDKIVCIEWMDSSGQDGFVSRNRLTGVCKLISVGWFIREDDEQVSIGMDYDPCDDTFRDVLHILKINILSRKEYKSG